ncbi:MAG: Uma2 family endonuclease [Synechocystis sp.]|nr:Uma2 family endonuclease [Synechocystis sp.]
MDTLTVNCNVLNLTDEQFFQLCQANRDLRFERNANGEMVIMSPTGGETSNRNASITAQLWLWNQQYQLGQSFDSSGGFRLPNGADRSPDAAWIANQKWERLTTAEKQRFLPFAPDFVIELLSPTDSLTKTQLKMQEYLDNGTQLGWLINRKARQVEIYRQGRKVEVLDNPESLSGESLLHEFSLVLAAIW